MAAKIKTKVNDDWEAELAPIRAMQERQQAESAALRAKIAQEVTEPIEEWGRYQKQIATGELERADMNAEWDGAETIGDKLKAAAERAKRLWSKAHEETQALQDRHRQERPEWPEEKLRDADDEAAAIMEALDHACVTIWALRARLRTMHQRGLIAMPETAARFARNVHYRCGEALPEPSFDPPAGMRETPWLALQGIDGPVQDRVASCPECGRLHAWTTAEPDPETCRNCGAAMPA